MPKKLLIIILIVAFAGVGLVALINSAYADVIFPFSNPTPAYQEYIESKQFVNTSVLIGLNFLINFLLLCIAYLIIKKGHLIKSWKFVGYVLLVTLWGYLIDYFVFNKGLMLAAFKGPLYPNMKLMSFVWLVTIVATFLALAIFNYFLAKKFFKLTRKQAIFIGIWMMILTSPLIGIILFGALIDKFYSIIFPFRGQKFLP